MGILRHPGREWKNRGGGEAGEEGSIRFDEIRKPSALKGAHFRGSVNFVPVDVYVFLKKKKKKAIQITLPRKNTLRTNEQTPTYLQVFFSIFLKSILLKSSKGSGDHFLILGD